ncbi:MAG: hypothetical protein L0Z55_12295 [Planctomycetes bacterium]|nr:hypothetical protein [Planctomycetota bacterium]
MLEALRRATGFLSVPAFTMFCVMLAAQTDQDHEIAISSASGLVGDEAVVTISFTSIDAVGGWSFNVCNDPEIVDPPEFAEVEMSEAVATASGGGPPDVTYFLVDPDGAFHIGVIVGFFGNTLAAGEDTIAYTVHYDLLAEGESTLEFCDHDYPSTPTQPAAAFFIDVDLVVPVIFNGSIEVIEHDFLRGDANGDGSVNGLTDAIFLLTWKYATGGTPPCLDEADVDDNRVAGTMADALFLLDYTFLDGLAPPAPGPFDCGPDATVDPLECEPLPACAARGRRQPGDVV